MIEKIKYTNHEDWLLHRRDGIGGSEAGIIMGVSKYGSPLTLWSEKMGIAPAKEETMAMKVGTFNEELVAKLWCERNSKSVNKINYIQRNPKYPWALANVDRRVIGEKAILECKTTSSPVNIRAFRTGEYPDIWYCQVQHYMAVTDCDRAYIACLVLANGIDFKEWTVPRDDEFIFAMMQAESDFWNKVTTGTPPDPNGHEDEQKLLQTMYPATDDEVDLTGVKDCFQLYKEYAKLEAQYKRMKDEQKNLICNAMGSASIGRIGDDKVCTWKIQHKNEYVVKASDNRVFRMFDR